jgi:hypothetical protein
LFCGGGAGGDVFGRADGFVTEAFEVRVDAVDHDLLLGELGAFEQREWVVGVGELRGFTVEVEDRSGA